MFGRNIRAVAACFLLAVLTCWNLYNSAPVKPAQKEALIHRRSIPAASMQPAIAKNNSLTPEALLPSPSQPDPLPAHLPPPVPEPISSWQGEIEQTTPASGEIPVFTRIPTDQPVVFLGIDDGLVKSPEAKDWLMSHKLPFTLFLEDDLVKDNYSYFRDLQGAGMTIQDHTITHTDLSTLDLDRQKTEICGAADNFETAFGSRPTLFRPPYGSFNQATKQAAAECGMKALIIWHAKANGGSIQFQDGNTHFLPGDIILMHFRAEFLQDMRAFTDQAAKDHLQVGRLEDWIQ
jgi:peptidoglycan/xylan/chitin deacetylase (PgdA/CDA1 family)